VVVITATDPNIVAWLKTQEMSAVMLRPDRYIAGVARSAAELDEISQCLPHVAEPVH
jgi:3-(3-hydroxy-phenyl)propionate hydroxylase